MIAAIRRLATGLPGVRLGTSLAPVIEGTPIVAPILWAMFAFQIKHFVCDFVLQTQFQIRNKGTYGHFAGFAHAGTHVLGSVPALLILGATPATMAILLLAEFVIQMGSYDADGNARPVGAPVALEANNGLRNLRGAVAMAREDDPNSATAEFFIDLADNSSLDHHADDPGNTTGYAVFGKVIAGMDVVDKIAGVALGDRGPMPGAAPVDPVIIRKVSVLP